MKSSMASVQGEAGDVVETKADQRILGTGDFVNSVPKGAEERHLPQLRAQNSGKKVVHIVHEECLKHGISTKELRAGGQKDKG
jgi:hypothetical protein